MRKLTWKEIQECKDAANHSFNRHLASSIRGKQSRADNPEWHLLQHVLDKMVEVNRVEQEPVGWKFERVTWRTWIGDEPMKEHWEWSTSIADPRKMWHTPKIRNVQPLYTAPQPQAKGEWVDDKTYWEAPQPPKVEQKPIYQVRISSGAWLDQTPESYQYNLKNGHNVRIVYATPQPQDALDVQNAKRWRWAFALSPDWSYAVCKWDGDDWIPINTDEDMRDLDAAIAASEKGAT